MATKAKKSAKASKKSSKKAAVAHLPSGYKVIGRAPNWDFDKHPVIEGERGPTNKVEFTDGTGKGKKKRIVRTCVVNDETAGPVTVWESGMLKDFFDQTEEGNVVRIEFLGYGQAKKGQNAPKLFSCAMKDE